VPVYSGLCTYLVELDSPTIVDNKANVLQYVMSSSGTTRPSIYFVLTTSKVSVENIPDHKKEYSTLMQAQRNINKGSSLHSFYKKVNKGYGKCYDLLYDLYGMDGYTGCVTSQEANDMKNMLHSGARLLFAIDSYIGKMIR